MALDLHFVPGSAGALCCSVRTAGSLAGSKAVLVVPPFAEEMNKCRRMISVCCQGLSQAGFTTIVPDLYGTGDSAGEFHEARWHGWREDLAATAGWLNEQGATLYGVLGVRLGCLLATDWLAAADAAPEQVVFWQPVKDLEACLKPLLRARVVQSQMRDVKESVASLLETLAAGGDVVAAGYRLPAALYAEARDLDLDTALTAAALPRPPFR